MLVLISLSIIMLLVVSGFAIRERDDFNELKKELNKDRKTIVMLHQDANLLKREIKDKDAEIAELERALDAAVTRELTLQQQVQTKVTKKK